MKTPWEANSDSITELLSVVHEANQNEFSAALAFKLSLLKKHILSPDSHGRSGFKLSPYPDIVGIPFAVMSSSESLQRITPVVSSPMTQPPPWWRTRSVPSSPDTHPYCLPISVSSRSAQRRSNSAGALKRPRFSHLSWVLSVERCARFPLTSQVKTTSCGLKSTLFNRLDVCDRLVVVQALGWGGVTWQRSCRTMYAVENIGVCTNFQWTITSEVNTEYFLFLLSIYIPQQEN